MQTSLAARARPYASSDAGDRPVQVICAQLCLKRQKKHAKSEAIPSASFNCLYAAFSSMAAASTRRQQHNRRSQSSDSQHKKVRCRSDLEPEARILYIRISEWIRTLFFQALRCSAALLLSKSQSYGTGSVRLERKENMICVAPAQDRRARTTGGAQVV
eukprot:SAG31_NODE_2858_length_4991_cov_1.806827_3_plen_159_part_00